MSSAKTRPSTARCTERWPVRSADTTLVRQGTSGRGTTSMAGEGSRQFLDTNVLVYAHDASAGTRRSRALDVLERAVDERKAAVSVQVLQEFFVTVTRKLPRPLS